MLRYSCDSTHVCAAQKCGLDLVGPSLATPPDYISMQQSMTWMAVRYVYMHVVVPDLLFFHYVALCTCVHNL